MKREGARCGKCKKLMNKIDHIRYVDEYGHKASVPFDGYECTKCREFARVDGGPILLPIPNTTHYYGKRHRCEQCGAYWHKTPISTYINRDGQRWHVSHYAYMWAHCSRCYTVKNLEMRYGETWNIDKEFFLDSIHKASNQRVWGFAFQYWTKNYERIGGYSLKPASDLTKEPYDVIFEDKFDYKKDVLGFFKREAKNPKVNKSLALKVRGIYLKEIMRIYLSLLENDSLLYETEKFLKLCGKPRDIKVTWGKEAAAEILHLLPANYDVK